MVPAVSNHTSLVIFADFLLFLRYFLQFRGPSFIFLLVGSIRGILVGFPRFLAIVCI
jgi:hypothetical protein